MVRKHAICALAAVLWSSTSWATYLEFDMRGNVCGCGGEVGPAASINFVINTQSLTSSLIEMRTFNTPNLTGTGVMRFDFQGLAVESLNVRIGSESWQLSVPALAYADGVVSSPLNGGDYDIYGSVRWDGGFLDLREMNYARDAWQRPIERAGVDASDDPVAYILQLINSRPAFTTFHATDFNDGAGYKLDMREFAVREVPEPSTAALLGLGLLSLLLARRRMQKSAG